MKCLFFSGGGTKFVGLAAMGIEAIKSGFTPDVIGGVSAGAILSVPLALGMYDEIISVGLNINADQMFSSKPTTNSGKITWRAIFRALTGKNSLGVQETHKFISSVISRDLFLKYKNGDYPVCYAMAVNFITGAREVWNLKTASYEEYLNYVAASSHIPVTTQPIYINDMPYFDGGLRDHTPSHQIIENLIKDGKQIESVVSVFSRPQDFVELDYDSTKNVMSVLNRSLRILNIEISKNDEEKEQELSKKYGFKLQQLFLPSVLQSFYDNDITRKKILIEESKRTFKDQFVL